MMSQQLLYMRQLAITNGSQYVNRAAYSFNSHCQLTPRFMAVSRLLDNELAEVTAQAQTHDSQQEQGQSPSS